MNIKCYLVINSNYYHNKHRPFVCWPYFLNNHVVSTRTTGKLFDSFYSLTLVRRTMTLYDLRHYWTVNVLSLLSSILLVNQGIPLPVLRIRLVCGHVTFSTFPKHRLRAGIWCAAFTDCDTGTSFPAALDPHGMYVTCVRDYVISCVAGEL